MGSYSLGFGVVIAYLVVVLMMLVLLGVLIRLLWALTRWVNRKADLAERDLKGSAPGEQ